MSVMGSSGETSQAPGRNEEPSVVFEPTGEHRAVTASDPSTAPSAPTTETGQHRAIQVVQRRASRIQLRSVLLVLVAGLVSFMAVGQLRGPDPLREQLNAESEGDLARILASLSSESTALQQELASLKVELANLQSSSQAGGDASAEAQQQLNALRVLSGEVAVTGPGLEVVIDDPNNQVTFDALVDAVQELRDAGAEALAINGRRIGVASSFGQKDNRITLDGVVLPTPYTLSAIGPASTMEGGLKIPGGALDTLRAINGATTDVHRSTTLNLPALEQRPTFRAARPVESGS